MDDNRQLRRKRQRAVGAVVGLFTLTLLVLSASQHRQHLIRRHRRHLASGNYEDEEPSIWSIIRRLSPLSKDEVNTIIFERHDEPYPDKDATFSPKPTLSPAPGGPGSQAPTPDGSQAPTPDGSQAPTPADTSPPTPGGSGTGPPTPASIPPGLSPTSAPGGTFAPTPAAETVEQFLTRTLTDDGSLLTAGTPQNDAYTYFTTSYPAIDTVGSDEVRLFVSTVYSLSTIYFSTGGGNWRDRTGWVGPTPPCGVQGSPSWTGVSCTGAVLDSLSLPENDLLGPLPSEIRGLPTLQEMNLGRNSLTGSIPPTIGEMGNLTALDLGENFLTGSIPATIGGATSLETLSLDMNQISGSIPAEINQMGNLRTLELNENLIEGAIPQLALPLLGRSIDPRRK